MMMMMMIFLKKKDVSVVFADGSHPVLKTVFVYFASLENLYKRARHMIASASPPADHEQLIARLEDT